MLVDRQGNPVAGATSESLACYEDAVHAFNIYRGDPVAFADQAIEISPDFAMAHVLKAYLFALATEPDATVEAASIVEGLKGSSQDDRVSSHVAALSHLVAGNWTQAALQLDRHSMTYPRDIVALQTGHLMDFFRANSRNLRDRILRALPHWNADVPGYSILLGLLSFGYEEAGNYARAEEAGRQALDIQPLDCWAHHAVAHVMEMQGRAQDGIGWMIAREPTWDGEDNFFKVHNWWHRAVFHFDLGQVDEAVALYDNSIRGDNSEVAMDLVDASAMLWRLDISGHDVGARWGELSDAWMQHADGKLYPFNDWHAAMSHLGAVRHGRVDDILAAYQSEMDVTTEVGVWRQEIGQPLIEGFQAFRSGRYDVAIEMLYPTRFIVNAFGGSHAQRDVIDWTLTEAAIRGGNSTVATAMANERLAHKPYSPMNKMFRDRAVKIKTAASQAA